ncbi:phage head closure protein [Mangrovibrevibacter kandeliae]|uniref:phage head closure protein n=1 Tax=Mangrovibrevibacter kandeliae TaxID=2968473 RepID=UPI002118F842|nr:phage head closure protein [Aurantimonas sp. CSK15Z-1]MCQ8781717.1 phage head closure protein [Aurantimonas sp. CSK15Z-1]
MDDAAGERNTEVLVEQSVDVRVDGVPTEEWSTVTTLWARAETRQADQVMRFGVELSRKVYSLQFAWMDGIAVTDFMRLRIGGKVFDISSIDRDEDLKRRVTVIAVESEADPARAREEWRQKMRTGEIVVLQRNDFDAGAQEEMVRAIVSGYSADEVVGGVDVGDRKIQIFAEDVTFADGIREGDQIVLRPVTPSARTLRVASVDDSTHRVSGILLAYELVATGA